MKNGAAKTIETVRLPKCSTCRAYNAFLPKGHCGCYNPFIDLFQFSNRFDDALFELLFLLEEPHRAAAFTTSTCLARVFTGKLYEEVVHFSRTPTEHKVAVPLIQGESKISAIQQIIKKILDATRHVHEALSLLFTADMLPRSYQGQYSQNDIIHFEEMCINQAEADLNFPGFRYFYQRMKQAMSRVGYKNFACMVTWSLNPPVFIRGGKRNLKAQAELYGDLFAKAPWSPSKRMEAILEVVEHSPVLFLSQLPEREFFQLISSRVPYWRWGGRVQCQSSRSECFLSRVKVASLEESCGVRSIASFWKDICNDSFRASAEICRASRDLLPIPDKTILRNSVSLLDLPDDFYTTRKISLEYRLMIFLETIIWQLLDGDGLTCAFQGPECGHSQPCGVKEILSGIWRNTKPHGAERWEKPPCIA